MQKCIELLNSNSVKILKNLAVYAIKAFKLRLDTENVVN